LPRPPAFMMRHLEAGQERVERQ